MSVITRATILTQNEILGIDDEVDLTKTLFEDHKLDHTTINPQCATEEICQSNHSNIYKAEGSDLRKNNEQENINLTKEYSEFYPMITTEGKQLGSTVYIWGGYVYTRDGYSRSFRCSNRMLYECSGRAVIRDGEVLETKTHSHPREPQILQVEQVKREMITRAQNDKSIPLRTIYLEACKTEPLVRSHLGLDMMMSKMKKARCETPLSSPKNYARSKKKVNFNFKWAKDWLDVPPGQDTVAFCNVCSKEIILPTRIRVYNHYLSKMHKRAALGLYRPPRKWSRTKKNSSKTNLHVESKADAVDADSDQEDSYAIEVLDQFQGEVERMRAKKKLEKWKNKDFASYYKEIIKLEETSAKDRAGEENESRVSVTASRAPTISLHVWDPNTGQPTSGLETSLYKEEGGVWGLVCRTATDERGKCSDLLIGLDLTIATYKLSLDTRAYYSERNQRCLYPFVEIVFDVEKVSEPYHFPVQLSPFAYNVSRLSIS